MERSWYDVLVLCRFARHQADPEIRSALLADLINAIDEVERKRESAFPHNGEEQLCQQSS